MIPEMSNMRPKLAMLTNPLGGYNLRHGGAVTALAEQAGIVVREGRKPSEITAALRELASGEPELLIVNGGDGTVSAVTRALRQERIFEKEPVLALLRGGSTNMIQNDVGLHGKPRQAIQRLLSHIGNGLREENIRHRAPLRVRCEGSDLEEYGFFWGAGALPRVIRSTQAGYVQGSTRGPIGETIALLGVLKSLLLGGPNHDPRLDPEWIDWQRAEHDSGANLAKTKRLFVFVTTLDRLILGLAPGSEGKALKLVSLKYPHARGDLLSYLKVRGRPSARFAPNFEFETGEELVLQITGDWVLDGELFEGNPESTRLHLKLDAPFRFLID
jgi:diacylglycerol kinase (ATP)